MEGSTRIFRGSSASDRRADAGHREANANLVVDQTLRESLAQKRTGQRLVMGPRSAPLCPIQRRTLTRLPLEAINTPMLALPQPHTAGPAEAAVHSYAS